VTTATTTPTDTAYRLASLSRVFVPNAQINKYADLRQNKLIRTGRDGFIALTKMGQRLLWSAAVRANEKAYR
jgi:hypothetical protein